MFYTNPEKWEGYSLSFQEYGDLPHYDQKRFRTKLASLIRARLPYLKNDPKIRRSVAKPTSVFEPDSVKPPRIEYHLFSEDLDLEQSMLCTSSPNDKIMTFEVFGDVIGTGAFGRIIKSMYRVVYDTSKKSIEITPSDTAIKLVENDPFIKTEAKNGNAVNGGSTYKLITRSITDKNAKSKTKSCMTMPFIEGISLADILDSDDVKLSYTEKFIIIYEFLYELLHVHNKGVIHADLSPKNIMYNPATGKLNIIDYGLSGTPDSPPSQCGTIPYLAPEANFRINKSSCLHSFKSDLWSAVLICLEIIARNENNPFTWNNHEEKQIPLVDIPKEYREKLISRMSDKLDAHERQLKEDKAALLPNSNRYKERKLLIPINAELDNIRRARKHLEKIKNAQGEITYPGKDSLVDEMGEYIGKKFNQIYLLLSRGDLIPKLLSTELTPDKTFDLPETFNGHISNFKTLFTNALKDDPNERKPLLESNASNDTPDARKPLEDLVTTLEPIYKLCYLKSQYDSLYDGVSKMYDLINAQELNRFKSYAKENDNNSILLKKQKLYNLVKMRLEAQKVVLKNALDNNTFTQAEYDEQLRVFKKAIHDLQTDKLVSEQDSKFWKIMDYVVARPLARIFGYTKSLSEQVIQTEDSKNAAKAAKLLSSLKTYSPATFANSCAAEVQKEANANRTSRPTDQITVLKI